VTGTVTKVDDSVVAELQAILDEPGAVLTNLTSRINRARVPAPFPVHRWEEHIPAAVVLPRTTEQVSEVVKLGNRYRIPIVPRAGGTGLADGAVPLRGGIVLDIKRMDQIKELDLDNRTVTVGPGINMLKLNEFLRPHGVFYPDDPGSYPVALVGGRIGTSGWSLISARYGHVRDLVISMEVVLPTGEVIRVGDGGGPKIRKSSTGFHLKQLFMGHQGSLGITTEAVLDLYPRPEAEFAAFFAFGRFNDAYKALADIGTSGIATLAATTIFDQSKIRYLRRDDEAFIPLPSWVESVICTALYGRKEEVQVAIPRVMELARSNGGRYTGDEMADGDWSSRHERYGNSLHGRLPDGQVAPMCWFVEDAALNYTEIPAVLKEWNELLPPFVQRYGIFDNWGTLAYTNNAHRPWGDYLVEFNLGIYEAGFNDETWAGWLDLKQEIARVTLNHGGSITACHGSTRFGDAELVPSEMGGGWEVMKKVKAALDPNNVMNPGKQMLDASYESSSGQP
jgi:glycolate oxidase